MQHELERTYASITREAIETYVSLCRVPTDEERITSVVEGMQSELDGDCKSF